MNTKDIIDALNIETNDKFSFSFKDATLDMENESCNIEIYYKDGVILSAENREKAEKFMINKLPVGFEYNFKFIKNFITKDTIIPQINLFFRENMPAVLYTILGVEEKDNNFNITISIEDKSFDHFEKLDGKKKLTNNLENYFCCKFNINVIDNIEEEIIEEELPFVTIESHEDKFIKIDEVTPFIGEVIDVQPRLVKDVNFVEGQDVCVCGKIKFLKELSYERKTKEKEPTDNKPKEEKNQTEDAESEKQSNVRIYYKWCLEGFTGDINCIYFTNKQTKEIMSSLQNGDEIVVVGDVEKSKFGNSFTMKIKKISRCKRPEKWEEKIDWKTENKNYQYIFPEPIEITKQVDLFGFVEDFVPEYLKGKNVVVFDFETTGLSVADGAKIIEIGAVKVIDGKIKEKFTCLVNPGEHIPEDSTKIHGITDADVENCHTLEEVMPDFYKFTRGCYLAGHNIIDFDCVFLNKYGRDCKYNFDNDVIDTYPLAMKYIKGVKNYKLGTLTAHYGITLDNAHRAWYDCYANAEFLIKLAELIKE